MKTLNALILASIKNASVGFIGIIIGLSIWESGTESKLPPFIAMNLVNLFVTVVYGIVFLLPLATLRTEEIKSKDLFQLFKKYLLLITVIPAIIFLLIFFNYTEEINVPDPQLEFDMLLMIPALLLSQQAAGLWQFLKTIKKQWE